MRQRKLLIIIVVVAAIAGAGYLFTKKDSTRPAVAEDKPITNQQEFESLKKEREAGVEEPVSDQATAEKAQQELQAQVDNPPKMESEQN